MQRVQVQAQAAANRLHLQLPQLQNPKTIQATVQIWCGYQTLALNTTAIQDVAI